MIEENIAYDNLIRLALENSRVFEDKSTVQRYELLYWSNLFFEDFMEKSKTGDDDLLFFVKEKEENPKKGKGPVENYFVRRKDSKNIPIRKDKNIDWERTYYLNVVINRLTYSLLVTIRRRNENEDNKKHKIVHKVTKKVYSSPAEVRMDEKKTEPNQYAYPKIYFSIHDFGETFKDIIVSSHDELVGVELVAKGTIFTKKCKKHIFRGALSYDSIKDGYFIKKKTSFWSKTEEEQEKFLALRGPNGKGEAQMAVNTYQNQIQKQEEENKLPEPTPSIFTKTGNTIKNAFSFFNKTKEQEEEVSSNKNLIFNCFLTYVNIEWDSIIKDLIFDSK
eukprot:TRINITY_DN2923_c1_g2_i1.p1 TRINITY_DN2923_c1_g2~~TRINITY_DN2923_c1_g2_i1.p1  ORF type:complete len:334 (+),score=106.47 TRINITY_DN2923_c1_g2_i1:59-1060(+)